MGQKVNPIGFRLGIHRDWDSRWFAVKEYSDFVLEDHKIRTFLKKRLLQAGVSKVEIERPWFESRSGRARISLKMPEAYRKLDTYCSTVLNISAFVELSQ